MIYPELKILLNILGLYLTLCGVGDAVKYHWQASAIRKEGVAKGHSRKFINMALHNDHVRIIYFIFFYLVNGFVDWYLFISAIIAVIFMTELWFVIYLYYPYRMRGCSNFKRPDLITYFINSLLPNHIRKRL